MTSEKRKLWAGFAGAALGALASERVEFMDEAGTSSDPNRSVVEVAAGLADLMLAEMEKREKAAKKSPTC